MTTGLSLSAGGFGGLALALALASTGTCAPECFFVDQSEDDVSLVVFGSGEARVVHGSFPEGAWVCGGVVIPPGLPERRPKRLPHRPIPPGDWTLDALAEGTAAHLSPDSPPRNDDRESEAERTTESASW